MRKAKALHIGINYCNGQDCQLDSPVLDATKLWEVASAKYEPLLGSGTLLQNKATVAALASALTTAAGLESGDSLLLTFSGYGRSVNQAAKNPAGKRGWVLSDGVFPFGTILDRLAGLAAGVQVIVISGCCFSGPRSEDKAARRRVLGLGERAMPRHQIALEPFTARQIQWAKERLDGREIGASVLHFAAAGFGQTTPDGKEGENSPFIAGLLEANAGNPCLPLADLAEEINKLRPKIAKPQIEPLGPAFKDAGPFCIV